MIKPDALRNSDMVNILKDIENAGFKIIGLKMIQLSKNKAAEFYSDHKGKPFCDSLVSFINSGPVCVAVLQKEYAVPDFRKLLGSTDPKHANPGTLRAKYASNISYNAVHGSDSDANAKKEISFFFSGSELFKYTFSLTKAN